MIIKINKRADAPETFLYVEHHKKYMDGVERPTIILVPGGPGGNHAVYDSIKNDLFELGDLILFDPRGCGLSAKSEVQYCTLDHEIEDIESIRKHFNIDKFVLLGGSYGAMVALGYGVQYQHALSKLILISGSPSFRFIDKAMTNVRRLGTEEQIALAEKLFSGQFNNYEEFTEYYIKMAPLYIHNYQPKLKPVTIKKNIPYNIELLNLGYTNFLRTFNFEENLHLIQCPTFIISGKNDWIIDYSLAELMVQKIPNSTLCGLEACGHFVWEDQEEEFFKALENFLIAG